MKLDQRIAAIIEDYCRTRHDYENGKFISSCNYCVFYLQCEKLIDKGEHFVITCKNLLKITPGGLKALKQFCKSQGHFNRHGDFVSSCMYCPFTTDGMCNLKDKENGLPYQWEVDGE